MLGELSTLVDMEAMATDELSKELQEDDTQDSKDSLQYTRRDEFTSELYKIEVRGLSKFFPPGPFKKLLSETMQLQVKKVKPCGPGKEHCYVTFGDEISAKKAMVLLEGYKWKGRMLSTSKASPAPDPLLRIIEHKEEGTFKCANEEMDKLPIEERVALSVTPYASMPYKEQLEKKQEAAHSVLKKIGREIAKVNPELENLVKWQKLRRKGAVCEIDPIIPSPVEDGYRNKCEFTIGINSDTKEPTVGFRVSSYKEGNVSVGPVHHLKHISDTMKNVVKSFETYIRASGHAAFDPVTHEGVWRQLTLRTSNNRDCLLIVTVHPQKLGDDQLKEIKQSLVQYCETEGAQVEVTGLYCIVVGQKESGVTDEYEHLWGQTHITENVLGKTFRVSPQAFFQVNTPAAEKLYEAVAELSEVDQTNVLLDVCCGTGTIGQCLAERTYKMYGLEIVEKAVEDAEHNARVNEITNVDYLLGNCEQTLPSIYSSCTGLEVKAVVDPPRAGLPASVISSLRRHEEVTSVVYMACDPNKCHLNFQSFARPVSKTMKGQFFFPIRAVAVDLFPHTDKYELVIVWERYDETKWRRIMEENPRPRDEAYFRRVPPRPSQAPYLEELLEKKKAKASTKREEISSQQWKPRFSSGGYGPKPPTGPKSALLETPGNWRSGTEGLRHPFNYAPNDNYSSRNRETTAPLLRFSGNNAGESGGYLGDRGGRQNTGSSGRGPYRDDGSFLGDIDNIRHSEEREWDEGYEGEAGIPAYGSQYGGRSYGFGNNQGDVKHGAVLEPHGISGSNDLGMSRRPYLLEHSGHQSSGSSRRKELASAPYSYKGQFNQRQGSTLNPGQSSYGGIDPYSAGVAGEMSGLGGAKIVSGDKAKGLLPPPLLQGLGNFASQGGQTGLLGRAPGASGGARAAARMSRVGGDEYDSYGARGDDSIEPLLEGVGNFASQGGQTGLLGRAPGARIGARAAAGMSRVGGNEYDSYRASGDDSIKPLFPCVGNFASQGGQTGLLGRAPGASGGARAASAGMSRVGGKEYVSYRASGDDSIKPLFQGGGNFASQGGQTGLLGRVPGASGSARAAIGMSRVGGNEYDNYGASRDDGIEPLLGGRNFASQGGQTGLLGRAPGARGGSHVAAGMSRVSGNEYDSYGASGDDSFGGGGNRSMIGNKSHVGGGRNGNESGSAYGYGSDGYNVGRGGGRGRGSMY